MKSISVWIVLDARRVDVEGIIMPQAEIKTAGVTTAVRTDSAEEKASISFSITTIESYFSTEIGHTPQAAASFYLFGKTNSRTAESSIKPLERKKYDSPAASALPSRFRQ